MNRPCHVEQALSKLDPPRVAFRPLALLDQYRGVGVDLCGQFRIGTRAEDRCCTGVGVDRRDLLGAQGKVSLRFRQLRWVGQEKGKVGGALPPWRHCPNGSLRHWSCAWRCLCPTASAACTTSWTSCARGLERKVKERSAELGTAQRKINAVLEGAALGVVAIGGDGRIVLVNTMAEKIFGYRREEMLGQTVETLLPQQHPELRRPHPASNFSPLSDRPMGSGQDLAGRRKDGTTFPVEINLSHVAAPCSTGRAMPRRTGSSAESSSTSWYPEARPLFAAYLDTIRTEGRAQGLMKVMTKSGETRILEYDNTLRTEASGQPLVRGVARDVTERKRAEKALEARSAELAVANEELEAFTYSVSHDLRTPLRHINLSAQFLLEDYGPGLGDEVLSDLRQIRETAVTAGKMVNDLLELSKPGRRKLERQPTELGALVEEVRHRLRPELNGRRVDWVIGDLPTIYCDPSLMERVLFNLLSNAIKYTRPRERPVIRVGQMVMNGQPVIFVRDNGVGFDPKQAEKLFQVVSAPSPAQGVRGHRGGAWPP